MKRFVLIAFSVSGPLLFAAQPPPPPPPPVPEKPADVPAPPAPASSQVHVYEQKQYGGGIQPLIGADQAQAAVDRFKAAYTKLNQPRVLIYVNRELIDTKTGTKLIARTEKTETTRKTVDTNIERANNGSSPVTINAGGNVSVNGDTDLNGKGKGTVTTEHAVNENRYHTTERTNTLADRQTVRDLERLIGRPLRAAGVSLVDQGVASQLIGNKSIEQFVVNTESDQARKDREALTKIADVVLEVLISSRNITVAEVSGDKTYTLPDIQITAIRLSDSKMLGQASSGDVVGRMPGSMAKNYDVRDVAEATAIALMDDIASSEK
jgi:hypothetical protein